jgi:hypothetical protein
MGFKFSLFNVPFLYGNSPPYVRAWNGKRYIKQGTGVFPLPLLPKVRSLEIRRHDYTPQRILKLLAVAPVAVKIK